MEMSQACQQVLSYAKRVFHRADGPDEVVPSGFRPDWADRPAIFRSYPGLERIALPTLGRSLERATKGGRKEPDIEALSFILYLMAGPMRRKLDIDWNSKEPPILHESQYFRRGTTSGGGLYPTQIYLVARGDRGLAAGVYHYAAAEHALVKLRNGRWAETIAGAVGSAGTRASYIVLSSDFWQNCYKYHNFGYHVCCEDAGAMMATAHLAADILSLPHRSFLEFDDAQANAVVGADGEAESVLAVIGLGCTQDALPGLSKRRAAPVARPLQRSRNVWIAPDIAAMDRLTRLGAARSCAPHGAEDPPYGVDPSERLRAFAGRQSAWSSMRGDTPVASDRLASLLGEVMNGLAAVSHRCAQPLEEGAFEIFVQANHVAGLPVGAYRWNGAKSALDAVESAPPAAWQSTYQMENYNLDEAGCILFIVGNLPAMLERYGPRGYRVLNAYVGTAAQLSYLSAARLDLRCGVVLGVRAQRSKRILLLDPPKEVFLAIFLSAAARPCYLFDFRLAAGIGP